MPRTSAAPVSTAKFPDIDEARAIKLILAMLPIPGLSGKESAISEFVVAQLRKAGVPASAITTDRAHTRSPIGGEQGNLICTLPGTIPGERRLLMSHLDTVPLCAGTRPVRENGFVRSGNPQTALGADNRSGVAATLNALLEIVRRKLPHPPLTVMWTVQEEVGLFGSRNCDVKLLKSPKLCFNWDGGAAEKISHGATGAYRMQIEITGLSSHAGVHPEDGISAISIAALAIADLTKNGWHGLVKKGSRKGTSNVGVISGGDATNVVTSRVTLRAEARSHDPVFRKKIVAEIKAAFTRAVAQVKNAAGKRGSFKFDIRLDYESFCLSDKDPSLLAATRVLKALGLNPRAEVANGGLDANWLTANGIPTITMGAGQQNAHTLNERLEIKEYLNGCRVALALATGA